MLARPTRVPPICAEARAAVCGPPLCALPMCAALKCMPPPPRAPKLIPPRCPPKPPCPPPPCPPPPCPPPPCPPPPPPRASASSVSRGTTRSSISAMQALVVNTSLTARRDWTRRTAAVGRALAYLHERRAFNTDTGVFLRSRRLTMSNYQNSVLSKLRLSLSGSSYRARHETDGLHRDRPALARQFCGSDDWRRNQ